MKTRVLLVVPIVLAIATLSGCDKPKWQDKPASAAPAVGAPKARVVPVDAGGTPAAPVWVQPLVGKSLRAVYPKTGICNGNTDIVQKTYAGAPAGVQIHGWGYDTAVKTRVARVVLVDKSMKIVGGGESGVARPDVLRALPEVTDPNTGWNADLPRSAGPLDAYGVTADDAVCVLGHIEF